MKLKRYSHKLRWVNLEFEFRSIGPRGVIEKRVRYDTTMRHGIEVVNVALGDYNENTGDVDYKAKSNNRDTDLVMATVASICLRILALCPTVRLYAEGATPARNR